MTENILIEPAHITAGKLRVSQLQEDLEAAKATLQQDQTDWKAGLDAGFSVDKDIDTAELIETLALTQSALEAANAKLEKYGEDAIAAVVDPDQPNDPDFA